MERQKLTVISSVDLIKLPTDLPTTAAPKY